MGRFRIEVDPDAQSAPTVELAESLKRLLAAERDGDPATTVAAAAETERAAHAATDRALLDADGTVPRRAMATALGRAHDAVNRRLKRIKTEQEQETTVSTRTVFAPKIATGDVVDDGNGGSYEQYGAVTSVTRTGLSVRVTTEKGTNLSFAVTDRVLVQR